MRHRILTVDDDPYICNFIALVLEAESEVVVAASGEEAVRLLDEGQTFDLILLDVLMPEMTGYDVIKLLKYHPNVQGTPVIFLTGRAGQEEEEQGFRLGAVDYIAKPISAPILTARVHTQLALKEARDRLITQNKMLDQKVQERTRELALTQDITILSLATLAETRDNETGNHIRRTQAYVRILADYLADGSPYADQLNEDLCELLMKSTPLHDIGKVG